MSLEKGAARFAERNPVRLHSEEQAPGVDPAVDHGPEFDPKVLVAKGTVRGSARFAARHGNKQATQALAEAVEISRPMRIAAQAEEDRRRGLAALDALEAQRRLETGSQL